MSETVQMKIDIYTWAKLEHMAAEQDRDVNEFAAEKLEEEVEKEHDKAFAPKVEATRRRVVAGKSAHRRARGVEATRRAVRRDRSSFSCNMG